MESIEKHILQLEKELFKSDIRKSSEKISELLANDFIEFCSSGSEYHYNTTDVFQEKNENNTIDWEIIDFMIKKLSDNTILAMYKLIKHSELNENKKYSLRSSIWKCYAGKWKMSFHQGTLKPQL